MKTESLLERTFNGGSLRVDRASGVIKGVRIIGEQSRNGRTYPLPVLQRARPFYEGRAVNLDHPSRPEDLRSVADRIGWLANVRLEGNGLVGDLNILRTHPRAGQIFEAAERNPSLFGLSHNADGRIKGNQRTGIIVEEIVGVRSVDLVTNPATTSSLFESASNQMLAESWQKPEWTMTDAEKQQKQAERATLVKRLIGTRTFVERQKGKTR